MSQALYRSWLLAILGLCVLAVPVLSVAQALGGLAPRWRFCLSRS